MARVRSRHVPGAETHRFLAIRTQLVDDVTRGVDHPDVPLRIEPAGVDAARRLDEVPRAGKTGGARGWRRPLHELVRERRNFRSCAVTARRLTDRHRTDRDEP